MSSESAVNDEHLPLRQAMSATHDIKSRLTPFLDILKKKDKTIVFTGSDIKNESDTDAVALTDHKKAEAKVVILLALGTLRYMNARLEGLDCSSPKNSLRMELQKIRGMLVKLQNLDPGISKNAKSSTMTSNARVVAAKRKSTSPDRIADRNISGGTFQKKGRIDVEASRRMVVAALGGKIPSASVAEELKEKNK